MYVPEGIEKIARLIKESLKGESLQVAEMLFSRELVTLMSHMAIDTGEKQVPNLMPETLLKYINMDDNLIDNKFYVDNYAIIKSIMAMTSIRSSTRAFYAREYANSNDGDVEKFVLESLSTNLLESLTVIVFLAKGQDEASVFDVKMKALTAIRIR